MERLYRIELNVWLKLLAVWMCTEFLQAAKLPKLLRAFS